MTPEELADRVCNRIGTILRRNGVWPAGCAFSTGRDEIVEAIREAEAAATERCAVICDEVDDAEGHDGYAAHAAALIRERAAQLRGGG